MNEKWKIGFPSFVIAETKVTKKFGKNVSEQQTFLYNATEIYTSFNLSSYCCSQHSQIVFFWDKPKLKLLFQWSVGGNR